MENYTSNELFIPKKVYTDRSLIAMMCKHFKQVVNKNNYFILSSETEKIVGYSAFIKEELIEKAVEYLKSRGYNVCYQFRTSGWGTFKAIVYTP